MNSQSTPDTRPSFEELMYQYRPLLNVSELERAAELPRNTISGCFGPAGLTGRKINAKHYARILWEIARVFGCVFPYKYVLFPDTKPGYFYVETYDETIEEVIIENLHPSEVQSIFRP